jgi:putative heme-binding domain-containing protein
LVGTAHCQDKPSDPIPEYLKAALLQEGNIERGKALFASERLCCAKCHGIDGIRNKAAPDLSAVGEKFGRREIIESVLTPSARISEGYETTMLLLKEGRVVSGIIKGATDQSIELLTQGGELIQFTSDEIDARRTSATSIMPEGIHGILSKAEFNDLIEFLVSLKQGDTATRITQGMPSPIHELALPVELRPIIGQSLKFDQPVWLGSIPGAADRFLVIEHQVRRIWLLRG